MDELILGHKEGSAGALPRMSPVLSAALHGFLVLCCLWAGGNGMRAAVLENPLAYEVALVTLEQGGGSGHAQATLAVVPRVESALPAASAPDPQSRRKPEPAPSKAKIERAETRSEQAKPVLKKTPREIAAAADPRQDKAAAPAARESVDLQNGKDGSRGAEVRASATGQAAGTSETSERGLPKGQGNGLGQGKLAGGIGPVDELPRILRKVRPGYPRGAREQGVTGCVTVRFLVDERGRVREPGVVSAEPGGVFEQSAMDALRRWRFKPARKAGRSVATWVVLPIRFSLE